MFPPYFYAWLKTGILIGSSFLYAGSACAQDNPYGITEKKLHTHVAFLCGDSLEGRLTGSKGEKLATQYAANVFQHLGLEPAGDKGTFFQEFYFTSGVSLGNNNSLAITNSQGRTKNLKLNQDWRPLSFSDNKTFKSTELVFAGYGITAPTYDSYHGLDVKNKWVIVFRYTPEKISDEERNQLNQYSSLRYKAFTAEKNGAKGIIFVSGPNSKVKNELIPLSFDTSLANSGIVAITVKDAVINELLRNNTTPFNSLLKLQDALDSGQLNITSLPDAKFMGQINIEQKKQLGRNVLAKLKVNQDSRSMIIVGAHVDHLGRGEQSNSRSQEYEKNHIHYGADDNASGVASVLEAAASLKTLQSQGKLHGNKDILFALWSGEELGLLGSSYFIKNFQAKTTNKLLRPTIDAYINLDMVGRLRKNLILQGVGSSTNWPTLIKQVSQHHTLSLITQNDSYLPTDSTTFYLHGVPAINLFTGSHDEYHTPRDTLELLNFNGIRHITQFLADLIVALEIEPSLLNFQQPQKIQSHHGRGFRVYLGTIPDYSSTDLVGVKLAGVTKGSPAEHAGLQQDDVIIELAGKKIHDIYDYTFVLSALHPTVPVGLVVLRGQTKVGLKITAQSRD